MRIVPVNGYIVTVTNWQPNLEGRAGPRYLAIAEALATDIDDGCLAAGARLPTHRDLAWRLGVTVGTVTRAYAEAARRGLSAGEVGRGTFVRERVPMTIPPRGVPEPDSGFIDLAYNFPPDNPEHPAIAKVIAEITAEGRLARLLGYEMGLGQLQHRAAGAAWLTESGLETDPDQVVVTAGAQHGLLLATAALLRPGEVLLTEELTYYGIKSIAALLDLRLHGLPMDEHGLLPEALESACRATGAKALYCIPTIQNPTASVMPEARRREIAGICRRHGIGIIEDDIYGFLPSQAAAPLSRHLPEQAIYVTSLSKCLAPGLRIGYLSADAALRERVNMAMRASNLMAAPLMAEVAARLIDSGRARSMALWQRAEAQARQKAAARLLKTGGLVTHPEAFHFWLRLPEPWRREAFAAEARVRGVGVAPAEVFAVGDRPVPQAVRVCLQAAASLSQAERALEILAGILSRSPQSQLPMV